jgi:Cu(I)/Ag(I) efflux system membrane fusion protein
MDVCAVHRRLREKLYVTSPGQTVETGQALLQVYSPDLATAEQELIKLLENRDRGTSRDIDSLIQSAKRRLRQWNPTEQQIEELEKNRIPSEYLTLLSPFRGIVEDVATDQGARFSMGQRHFPHRCGIPGPGGTREF